MTSLAQEFQSVLTEIRSIECGEAVLSSVTAFAKSATKSFFHAIETGRTGDCPSFLVPTIERVRESATARVALAWMGERTVAELFEKNLTLIFGRLVHAVSDFDAINNEKKLQMVVDVVVTLSESIERWVTTKEHELQPTHDKKERRRRRAELPKKSSEVSKEVAQACIAACEQLKSVLLPQGIDSLFLPSGSRFFSHWIVDVPDKIAETFSGWVCQNILTREHKAHVLFGMYTWLFQNCVREQHELKLSEEPISRELCEKLATALPPIMTLLAPPSVSKAISFLPRKEAAERVLQFFSGNFSDFSFKKLLSSSCSDLLSFAGEKKQSEVALEATIGMISHDERVIKALVRGFMPRSSMAPGTLFGTDVSFLSLFAYGMQASARDEIARVILGKQGWQEEIDTVLRRCWWFVASPFFDRWLYSCIQRIFSPS